MNSMNRFFKEVPDMFEAEESTVALITAIAEMQLTELRCSLSEPAFLNSFLQQYVAARHPQAVSNSVDDTVIELETLISKMRTRICKQEDQYDVSSL